MLAYKLNWLRKKKTKKSFIFHYLVVTQIPFAVGCRETFQSLLHLGSPRSLQRIARVPGTQACRAPVCIWSLTAPRHWPCLRCGHFRVQEDAQSLLCLNQFVNLSAHRLIPSFGCFCLSFREVFAYCLFQQVTKF